MNKEEIKRVLEQEKEERRKVEELKKKKNTDRGMVPIYIFSIVFILLFVGIFTAIYISSKPSKELEELTIRTDKLTNENQENERKLNNTQKVIDDVNKFLETIKSKEENKTK